MTEVAHSRFGGSVIGRILACPGSVALCDTVPPVSSRYAAEGSAAHRLAEACLTRDLHPLDFLDTDIDGFKVTHEMAAAVRVYCEAVTHELALTKTAELYVEKGFKLDIASAADGEVFGTNDAMVYHPETGRLRVFDYKHGVGVSVSAEDNAQLKFYAAGAVFSNPWPIKELILTIVQPRARDADEVGAIKDWTFETPDLFEFIEDVSEAVRLAKTCGPVGMFGTDPRDLMLDNLLVAGYHCDKSFCDARVVCPAYQALKLAGTGFEDVVIEDVAPKELPHPSELSNERLAAIVAGLSGLSSWMNVCQEYLEAKLLAGEQIPGWKVVEKIGRAKWVADEKTVADELEMLYSIPRDLVLLQKLTTIGDVEKLMKAHGASRADIEDMKLRFTLKESSGLTIAPEGDRRPAVNAAERAFGDVQI